jgi:hypothetical protein
MRLPAVPAMTAAEPAVRLAATTVARFANDDFLLSGEVMPGAPTQPDTIAAAYAVYDARLLANGSEDAALGRVEILVYPERLLIDGLVRLEIAAGRRQRGAGRRLIQAMAATAPDYRLNIYDIQPSALDFWIALGCAFRPRGQGLDASYVLPPALRVAPID